MSRNAIYRDRRAHVVGEFIVDGGWVGVILDYGDGLTFGVTFADKDMIIDPTDDAWFDALPRLPRLPGPFVTLPDGTTAIMAGPADP